MEVWVAGSHSDLGVLDQLYIVLHAVPQVILSVLCFRLLNSLHLNLPISLRECFKRLLATHARKDHDRVIFHFKLTCNLENNIRHLESKYTGHLSSSWWHSHIFSQHKSKEKLDETSLRCPAVAIVTSRRYCSHLYCTAYSQRKQSGGLEIKPNGVIKKKIIINKKKKPLNTRSAPQQTDSLCFFTGLLAWTNYHTIKCERIRFLDFLCTVLLTCEL